MPTSSYLFFFKDKLSLCTILKKKGKRLIYLIQFINTIEPYEIIISPLILHLFSS